MNPIHEQTSIKKLLMLSCVDFIYLYEMIRLETRGNIGGKIQGFRASKYSIIFKQYKLIPSRIQAEVRGKLAGILRGKMQISSAWTFKDSRRTFPALPGGPFLL